MLLNKSITLADIEAVDPDLHQSLTWMLDNCIEVRENGEGNFYNQNEQIKRVSNKKIESYPDHGNVNIVVFR